MQSYNHSYLEEQEFVIHPILNESIRHVWIGAVYEEGWRWVSGEVMEYQQWSDNDAADYAFVAYLYRSEIGWGWSDTTENQQVNLKP